MSKESYDISVGYSISQVVYQKHYPLFCEFLRVVEMTDDRLKAMGTSTPLSSGAGLTGTESLIFGGTGTGIFGVDMTGTSIFGGAGTETKTPISDGAGNEIAFAGLRTRVYCLEGPYFLFEKEKKWLLFKVVKLYVLISDALISLW